jgi:hypothetical protein
LGDACSSQQTYDAAAFRGGSRVGHLELRVEVPVNEYPTRESFAQALVNFGIKKVVDAGELDKKQPLQNRQRLS